VGDGCKSPRVDLREVQTAGGELYALNMGEGIVKLRGCGLLNSDKVEFFDRYRRLKNTLLHPGGRDHDLLSENCLFLQYHVQSRCVAAGDLDFLSGVAHEGEYEGKRRRSTYRKVKPALRVGNRTDYPTFYLNVYAGQCFARCVGNRSRHGGLSKTNRGYQQAKNQR